MEEKTVNKQLNWIHPYMSTQKQENVEKVLDSVPTQIQFYKIQGAQFKVYYNFKQLNQVKIHVQQAKYVVQV